MKAFEVAGQATRTHLPFTPAPITQLAQTAVCCRHPTVDERRCRRLLRALARAPGAGIVMGHERRARRRSALF